MNMFLCVWIFINLHDGRIQTNIAHRLFQTRHFKSSERKDYVFHHIGLSTVLPAGQRR